jgi:hypothetical protein
MNIKETKKSIIQAGANPHKWVVYRHIRKDKNVPFYIGIGKNIKRAYEKNKKRRSKFWINITNKTDYDVEILFENISCDFAKEKEKEFIKLYGRIDNNTGSLCNMTDGGDGVLNQYQSEKTRKKRALSITGKKNGMYGKTHSDELKKYWSENRIKENHPRAKKVINKNTGEIFNCVKNAAEANNIKYTTLTSWLNGSRKNKSPFEFLI